MIIGEVNRNYEMVVPYSIQDSAGVWHVMEAILDTGFTGSLTLPSPVIALLGLPWRTQGISVLADGKSQEFAFYEANVIWNGEQQSILVHAVDFVPLLGLRLMANHHLNASFQVGGAVQIEAIQQTP